MSPDNRNQTTPFSIVAATFTAFAADGSVALEPVKPYVEHLLNTGVDGIFICGTSGEGFSLTIDERKKLADAWIAAAAGRMRVIVHIGHTAVPDSVDLGRHAAAAGANGISAIGPTFFPPTQDGFIEYNRLIAASAPDLPYYYYHFPVMSRVSCEASAVYRQLAATIPNFRGVKFTDEDVDDFAAMRPLRRENDELFFGRDEMLLTALQNGARGAVGSTYNFAAPLYRQVIAAFDAGNLDEADRLQQLASDAIDCMKTAGGLGAIRTLVSRFGIHCGQPRSPLPGPTKEQCQRLLKELDAMGYWATQG